MAYAHSLVPEMKSWFISAFISCDVSPSLALSQVQAVHGAGVGGCCYPGHSSGGLSASAPIISSSVVPQAQ